MTRAQRSNGSHRTRLARASAAFALAALIASACGSDDSSGDSKGKCSQGDTRACLGPGACNGAQSCGADGTWSTCDCGGATGGSGGGSGSGRGGGEAGVAGGDASLDGAGSSGSSDGGGGAPACPTGKGPAMVDVGKFCIDTTEVTQTQYAEFLSAKGGDVSGQPEKECSWNTDYEPALFALGTKEAANTGCNVVGEKFDPIAKPQHPVSCIDWCDAHAFCEWAGKRLCAWMGDHDAQVLNPMWPQDSEWVYAASNGGVDFHQYGVSAGCVVGQEVFQTQPVKSRPDCHGGPSPYDQIYDLSGNVAEFAFDCTPGWGAVGPTNECYVHGGDFSTSTSYSQYNSTEIMQRNAVMSTTGFRCCANPSK